MRIVQYYPRALSGDGGMTGAVTRLARALKEEGAQSRIIYDGEGARPALDDSVEWVGVSHIGPSGQRLPRRHALAAALRDADVVVVHSAWAPHNVVAAQLARHLGVPYVVAPRGAYDPCIVSRRAIVKRAWWLAAERGLVERSRAVHLFFDVERPHLDALGYRGAVLVAPNGVEPPAGVAWDGGSDGAVVWMGRFDPQHKGIDLLVRAIALISPSRRPQLRLHGPDRRGGKDMIQRLIADLEISRWVTVADALYGDEKWSTLSRAQGFVYPSRWEGFGNSLAEAASIGLPTLATPYPLARTLSGRGGALLAEPSPEALAAGLQALIAPSAREFGARGRRVMRDDFSWSTVARAWLHQTEDLLRPSPVSIVENRRIAS